MRQLVDLGLVRAGVDGDTFGPVQQVLDLLAQVNRREDETGPAGPPAAGRRGGAAVRAPGAVGGAGTGRSVAAGRRACRGHRTGRWDSWSGCSANAGTRVCTGPPAHLPRRSAHRRGDPSGIAAEGDAAAALRVLHGAGLVRLDGRGGSYRVESAARRLLGDLAHPDEVGEPGYRRELAGLQHLLERTPGTDDGVANELAAATTRTFRGRGQPADATAQFARRGRGRTWSRHRCRRGGDGRSDDPAAVVQVRTVGVARGRPDCPWTVCLLDAGTHPSAPA